MATKNLIRALAMAIPLVLSACASPPPPASNAPAPPVAAAPGAPADSAATSIAAPPPADGKPVPAGQKHYKWSRATEADVAAQLDEKFRAAAKEYVQLKRDDQVMFCKKYREMGSSIRTLHCITEAELRKQVEDSDQVREQMRHKMGKCDIHSGCSAGG